MSNTDLVTELRVLEIDHAPDGWPAVRMSQITALLDEIERLRAFQAAYVVKTSGSFEASGCTFYEGVLK